MISRSFGVNCNEVILGATSVKNSLTSPLKSVAASSSHGSMNLTDILSRLVYGSTVADESENGNKSGDELLVVLDKITRVGQQLQAELQVFAIISFLTKYICYLSSNCETKNSAVHSMRLRRELVR